MPLKPTAVIPALLAICALLPLPALAEVMSKAQISQQIIGKDLTSLHKGIPVHLHYGADGSVRMRALFFSGSGTWKFAKSGLCVTLTSGPKPGTTCLTFEDLGDGTYRNSEGMILRAQK